MKIIIHTAEIEPNGIEDRRIFTASLDKQEILNQMKEWKKKYPQKRIRFKTIIDGG